MKPETREKWLKNNRDKVRRNAMRYYYRNKEKRLLATKRWRKDPSNSEAVRAANLKRSRQKSGCLNPTGETKTGPCEICHNVCRLEFDHCHKSRFFRGWLCRRCNVKLGALESSRPWYGMYKKRIDEYLDKKLPLAVT